MAHAMLLAGGVALLALAYLVGSYFLGFLAVIIAIIAWRYQNDGVNVRAKISSVLVAVVFRLGGIHGGPQNFSRKRFEKISSN